MNDERMEGCQYKPRDWVDVVWFGDHAWWDWHKLSLKTFCGLKAHPLQFLGHKFGTKRLARGKPRGIETRSGYVSWNFCSGSSAINLAVHFGVDRIVLLGFDMKKNDGSNNWHHNHKKREDDPYPKYLACYPAIAVDAEKIGVEILNATPGSAIKQFPFINLEDML